MKRILRVVRRWMARDQWERELSEEIEFHREMKTRELERAPAGDSSSEVRREMGNVTFMKEESRAVWIWPWIESLAQDIRIELRQLRKSPAFAVTTIAILALGIGLNAAIFTLLNGIVLRSLPLPDPDRLVMVLEREPGGCCSPPSWLDQRDLREQNHSFQSMAVYSYESGFIFQAGDRNRRLTGGYVTPDYFSTLGVRPVMGRVFNSSEAQAGRDNVVLVREDFWRSELNGDPNVLAKTVLINGRKCNIIGVLPSWFRFPWDDAVLWAPLVPTHVAATERGWHGFPMIGRLKPETNLAAAQAEIDSIVKRMARKYPADANRNGIVFSLQSYGMGGTRTRLMVLQFAALAVFLMTCANVSSLLLARHATRRREFAVRAALGASRMRQVRQHLTESLLLAAVGCAAGIGIAWAGVRLLLKLYHDALPRVFGITVDWRLVLFTVGIAIAGAIAFGLTTTFHESTKELERSLRDSSRSSLGRSGTRLRQVLVVVQLGCALCLLAGAGELIRSFWNLMNVDIGINTAHLTTMRVELPTTKYNSAESVAVFLSKVVERIRSSPGIQDAAAINMLPVQEAGRNSDVEVDGLPPHSPAFFAEDRFVAGDYFRTMGIPLLRGRSFLADERSGKHKAVIVNATMARALWGGKDPLGYQLRGFTSSSDWYTVVGVVRDVRQAGLEWLPRSELFAPVHANDEPITSQSLVVRSSLDIGELAKVARGQAAGVDSEAAVFSVKTMRDVVRDSLASHRITTVLLLLFAVLALLLAAFGMYGIVSYSVAERKREFAIRMALGANTGKLIGMVMRQSLFLIAAGVILGVTGAFVITRLLANLLYGLQGPGAGLLGAVTILLCAVVCTAALIPSLRTLRLDPMIPLREE
jgi:Acidobacterial duplicated orphan permease